MTRRAPFTAGLRFHREVRPRALSSSTRSGGFVSVPGPPSDGYDQPRDNPPFEPDSRKRLGGAGSSGRFPHFAWYGSLKHYREPRLGSVHWRTRRILKRSSRRTRLN